jgi:hypothetical protein
MYDNKPWEFVVHSVKKTMCRDPRKENTVVEYELIDAVNPESRSWSRARAYDESQMFKTKEALLASL